MSQELFDLYTDYLNSAFGPTTATGLARMLDGQVSHDQVTRLLATAPKESADFWRIVKPLVRQIERLDAVLHKEFIMPLKRNRKVAVSEADKRRGQDLAVSTLNLPADTTRTVWLEDVPFAVLLTKQVFTNEEVP